MRVLTRQNALIFLPLSVSPGLSVYDRLATLLCTPRSRSGFNFHGGHKVTCISRIQPKLYLLTEPGVVFGCFLLLTVGISRYLGQSFMGLMGFDLH